MIHPKNIIFSGHSELKLQQRNIEKGLVIKTIQNPDYKLPGKSGRKISYKKFGHLYLKVVFAETDTGCTIITQHWEQKFKPYKT